MFRGLFKLFLLRKLTGGRGVGRGRGRSAIGCGCLGVVLVIIMLFFLLWSFTSLLDGGLQNW